MIRQRTPLKRKRDGVRRKRDLPELRRPKPEPIKVMDDGREICNLKTAIGRLEYQWRVEQMVSRQIYLCCNCREPLATNEATFEHENGRGAAKQDDRIEIDGKPVNGASHGICNAERGSKRTPIWHGPEKF